MLINVPLDHIDDNPFQRRQDYGDVENLARDIDRNGLLQPPRGRLTDSKGYMNINPLVFDLSPKEMFTRGFRVQLAFGHRRLRAYRHLNATTPGIAAAHYSDMPVIIQAMTDDELLDAVWSENQKRLDFNPIEQAELMAAKLEQVKARGGTQATVADLWGIARSTVANKIRLLELPEDAKAAVRSGQLSERQAIALLSATRQEITDTLADPGRMTSDAIREAARKYERAARLKPREPIPALLHARVGEVPNSELWDAIKEAARDACDKCIAIIGPPNANVCRECPAVTMVKTIHRRLA